MKKKPTKNVMHQGTTVDDIVTPYQTEKWGK